MRKEHKSGLTLQSQSIGDLTRLDVDSDPTGPAETVLIEFGGCENLATGRLYLTVEQAASLSRDLDDELVDLGHDPHEMMIMAD